MAWKRLTSRQAVDTAYAVVFVLVLFQATVRGVSGSPGLAILAGFGLALAIRRRSPRLSLALAWALAVVQMAGSVLVLSSNVAVFGILYCSAAYGDRLLRRLGLASAVVGGIVAAWYLTYVSHDPFVSGDEAVGNLQQFVIVLAALWAVLGLSWALGRLSYARRSAIEAAHAQELAELEQARAQNDIAIEQERNRIARDMHDIVAHSLAVVIAQADGARYVRAVDPEAVDTALTTISATARDALGDVRILLAQLRHSEDDLPTPALTDIGRLLDRMRAAGLRIDASLSDAPVTIGAAAQLALYRIAQESLTNALRHGDTERPVSFTVETDSTGVELIVVNSLTTSSHTEHHGHGVVGMRERAALSGGVCTAGAADGRWTVRVRIPATKGT
ncbi:sensor histidine kinase [Rhodococcus sp. P1Y]|uniref:sensor histidine kinase n=1 Tax=Rhodococcus sp. P1Y TaxID=1302308 RepID=UPI000EAB48B9|nr:histidine kinase [Rhodococcus sp. P1Y]AYJ51728.1 sensor histidine kinase [Rhodococcus sp. P1Y]